MVLNRPEMSSKRVGCDKKALFRHTEERLIKSLRTAIWGQIACPGNNNRKTTFLVTYCCPAINHLKASSHCHQQGPVQLLVLLLAQHSAPWFPTSVQQALHALILTQQGGMLLAPTLLTERSFTVLDIISVKISWISYPQIQYWKNSW